MKIKEKEREIEVFGETDVLVVGGGPAGFAAAIASAREGVKTMLIERYNHLGGMATGGLVILLPHLSGGTKDQVVAGICRDLIKRLDRLGGAFHPPEKDLGSKSKRKIERFKYYQDFVVDGRIRMSVIVDPELMKYVLIEMIEEVGVRLLLHSLGVAALCEDGRVKGVIFESKSGRKAILSKITIDATGDGDIFYSAGAEFDSQIEPSMRSGMLALVFRLGNVDYRKYAKFRFSSPEKWNEVSKELESIGGFKLLPLAAHRNDIVWVNNWVPGKNCLKVEDLTSTEVQVRKVMLKALEILREKVPGFEKAFILDTASQIGTRGSRRLKGQYVVTKDDVLSGKVYEDTIAVIPPLRGNISSSNPFICIPYRALVPEKIENLLVAGRCFSSDAFSNDIMNLIPFCIAMGEAAGTASAIALKEGVLPREVNYKTLRESLIRHGVFLP